MNKPYAVKIKAFATVVVWAKSAEDALERTDDVDFGNLTMDEATAKEIKPENLDSEKRHADLVLRP